MWLGVRLVLVAPPGAAVCFDLHPLLRPRFGRVLLLDWQTLDPTLIAL